MMQPARKDLGNVAVVQIPVVFFGSRFQLREALRMGNDFAQVQRAAHFLANSALSPLTGVTLGPVNTLGKTRWSFSEDR